MPKLMIGLMDGYVDKLLRGILMDKKTISRLDNSLFKHLIKRAEEEGLLEINSLSKKDGGN
jgi:hypothetical protein